MGIKHIQAKISGIVFIIYVFSQISKYKLTDMFEFQLSKTDIFGLSEISWTDSPICIYAEYP